MAGDVAEGDVTVRDRAARLLGHARFLPLPVGCV